ncbi:hypothetical protein CW700_01890 [Candidatus Bathyarchaeota archaeon]|nr:MAG: hypothetical protein CW700_01890 [Candidatus Bathyarchaeota archaeon]
MGRRRRKVVKVVKRKLPEFFLCPRCGKNTVKVSIDRRHEVAVVVCGACGLKGEFPLSSLSEPVDIYCSFVDQFYARPRTR